MFSSIKRFFEKFSFTDENDIPSRRPLVIKKPIGYCFNKINSYISNFNYKEFISRKDYNEIYFVDSKGNEVTLLLLENKGSETIISCHVASSSINTSSKKLIETMKEIKELFPGSSKE